MTITWRRFMSQVSLIFIGASTAGILTSISACLLIGRFNEQEIRFTTGIVGLLMILGAMAQFYFDRRWLRRTREYLLASGTPSTELIQQAYRELTKYPWRGSTLGFLIWQTSVVIFVIARFVFLDEVPLYRHTFIFSIAFGAAFLNWTIQYFLLRRHTYSILEHLNVDRAFAQSVERRSVTRKYVHASTSMLVGIVIIGGMIAYGLNRNLAMTNLFRQTHSLLVGAELLLYEYEFGEAFDIQSKVAEINNRLPGTLEIVSKPDPNAIEVSATDKHSSNWFIFPVYTTETQRIFDQMLFYRGLSFGSNRQSSSYLQYTLATDYLQSELVSAAVKITGLGLLLALLMTVSTVGTTYQLGRPIRTIRTALHPQGESVIAPPMVISDDELMGFSVGIRSMFLRLQELFQQLLEAYWNVKDERAHLHEIATRFQQHVVRDAQQIQILTGRLRELTDDVQGFGEQLEAMSKVSDSVTQSVRLMTDTMGNMQNEMISIRTRIHDSKEWLVSGREDVESGNRTMASLEHWIGEATQDFDLILRRFRDLLGALKPVDQELVDFSDHMVSGSEYVKTIYHLLTSETDRYNEGVGLIERTQYRLDEVMETFERVESIREQIDMLSFQAAVVASQSNEYERDFRVVADEIRDLSERAAAGIHQVFTAIWALDQQGKQTIGRIVKSRQGLNTALEVSQKAFTDAQQGVEYSETFTAEMHRVLDVIRSEARRTETLVDSLKEPFTRGAKLRVQVDKVADLYQVVEIRLFRLDDISRGMELRIRDQQEALRHMANAMDRVAMQLRELMSAGEGIVGQSRTLRSILERLNSETQLTSSRVDSTIADLHRIEAEIFRNEIEVKRISAELQTA